MISPQAAPTTILTTTTNPHTLSNSNNNNNNNNKITKMSSPVPSPILQSTQNNQPQGEDGGRPIQDIAQEFSYRLKDLTYNDAIIINKLMHYAADNIKAAKEISTLIEDRIRKSTNPKQRLAVLYLLDSITKNVGKIYKQLFAVNIVNTYCSSFELVDDTIKVSLLNLYNTWTGYFDQALLDKIHQRCGAEEMARIAILKKQIKPSSSSQRNQAQRSQQQKAPSSTTSSTSSRDKQPSQQPTQQPTQQQVTQQPIQQQPIQQQPIQQPIQQQPTQQQTNQQPNQQWNQQQQQQQQQMPQNKLNVGTHYNNQWSSLLTQNYPHYYSTYSHLQQVQDPRVNKGSAPFNGQFNNNTNNMIQNNMMNNNSSNSSSNMMINQNTNMINGNMVQNNNMMNQQQQQQYNNNNNSNSNNYMNNTNNNTNNMQGYGYMNTSNLFPIGSNNNQLYNNFNSMIQSFNLNTTTNSNQQYNNNNSNNNYQNGYSYFNNMNMFNMNNMGDFNTNMNSGTNNNNNSTNSNNNNNQADFTQITQEQNQLFQIIEQSEAMLQSDPDNEPLKSLLNDLKNTLYRGTYNQSQYAYLKQQFANLTSQSTQIASPKANITSTSDDSSKQQQIDNISSEPFNPAEDLYDALPFQCNTCALRFDDNELKKKHMDWHWKMNKKEKKKKKQAMSRSWFIVEDEWINFEFGVSEINHEQPALPFLNAKHKKEDEQKPLPNMVADDEQPNCPVCREKFEKFWDETNEEWMFKGVEMNDKMNKIVHVKCNGSPKLDDSNGINKPPSSSSSAESTKEDNISILPSPKLTSVSVSTDSITSKSDKKRELDDQSELIESNSDSPERERESKKLKNE